MYSTGACATLGISNQDALNNDLESDPFLNSAPQRFTFELDYQFGSFLAPLSIELITGRHYLQNTVEKMETTTSNKYAGLGAELIIVFWFGFGIILAIGVVDCLNHSIGVLTSGH